MTQGRVTQAPVEVLERMDTTLRVTQAPVEVLERFDTTLRVTQACVEVMWRNPLCCDPAGDFSPLLRPTTISSFKDGAAQQPIVRAGSTKRDAPSPGSAKGSAPAPGSAKVGK
jgi:hypothetical protein